MVPAVTPVNPFTLPAASDKSLNSKLPNLNAIFGVDIVCNCTVQNTYRTRQRENEAKRSYHESHLVHRHTIIPQLQACHEAGMLLSAFRCWSHHRFVKTGILCFSVPNTHFEQKLAPHIVLWPCSQDALTTVRKSFDVAIRRYISY
jgi:hypothetical protein